MSDNIIQINNMNKWFGDFQVLKGINLEVKAKEKIVVCGPSGSGKSTFIRTINGLEPHDSGKIIVDGKEINDDLKSLQNVRSNVGMVFQQFNLFPHLSVLDNIILAPQKVKGLSSDESYETAMTLLKRVGMVFQQFNLFPHLSILENITLAPLNVQKRSRVDAEEFGMYLLNQMGISMHAEKYPSQLSGGEQQRVAIARALALKPELLLFDEPTSALDPERINEVLDVMRKLAQDGMTMVVVTHEINFAKDVSDQILFMDSGKVIETSTPDIFFSNAKHERSRKFLNQLDK